MLAERWLTRFSDNVAHKCGASAVSRIYPAISAQKLTHDYRLIDRGPILPHARAKIVRRPFLLAVGDSLFFHFTAAVKDNERLSI